MQIEILLFASAADLIGQRRVSVEVPDDATVSHAVEALRTAAPQLAPLIAISRWAVDREFVPLTTRLRSDQEIALIPPVSGG